MNVAFIPVRGGSKSIPLKNIKPIGGKPLVYWTVKAACACKYIDRVYVATDSDIIKDTVENFKNGVETILFKGITTNGNPIPPLVTSVNNDGIRMYFDKFFQNGKYLNYIKENKGTDRVQAKSSNFRQIGIVANVDAESLKQLLIKDKIIPK